MRHATALRLLLSVSISILPLSGFQPRGLALAQSKESILERLINGHLEAIGKNEARRSVLTRYVRGSLTRASIIGEGGRLRLNAEMISSGTKTRFSMRWPEPQDLHDEVVYDGKRAVSERMPVRRRVDLTFFLYWHTHPLTEGLFGGVLSTAWPLLKPKQLRLVDQGIRKVDGRQLHAVEYRTSKGTSDLKIMLHFDPQTFRHLRTEYKFEGMHPFNGPIGQMPQFIESKHVLTEEFDDFRIVEGLTLPHKYSLRLSENTRLESRLTEWDLYVGSISHNDSIEERVFKVK
jgi:hypothetical protein